MNNIWNDDDDSDDNVLEENVVKIKFVPRQKVIDNLLDSILEEGRISDEVREILTDLSK